MTRLILLSLSLFLFLCVPNAFAWKEPAWTANSEERIKNSDAVFVGAVESISESRFHTHGGGSVRQAAIKIEQVKKITGKLESGTLTVFFEAPREPGPDRGWVTLFPGQRAMFYTRFRVLSPGEKVLFLDFQSDVQAP